MTEDLDPIETAIGWLRHAVNNNGRLSPHDLKFVRDTIIPEAVTYYQTLNQDVVRLSAVIDALSEELNQLKEDIKF
jgi:hypothetical protein